MKIKAYLLIHLLFAASLRTWPACEFPVHLLIEGSPYDVWAERTGPRTASLDRGRQRNWMTAAPALPVPEAHGHLLPPGPIETQLMRQVEVDRKGA